MSPNFALPRWPRQSGKTGAARLNRLVHVSLPEVPSPDQQITMLPRGVMIAHAQIASGADQDSTED